MKIFVDANLLIYLNVGSTEDILDLWISLLTKHDIYTDPLVLGGNPLGLEEEVWGTMEGHSRLHKRLGTSLHDNPPP